ncbi:MAG: hypothetical protein WBF53_00465 [Litorimonas sp.]
MSSDTSDTQALRRLVALKRGVLQSRIDAAGQREAKLARRIAELRAQGDGLAMGEVGEGGFQLAALAGRSARDTARRLDAERAKIAQGKRELVRERIGLDLAERKLADAARAEARLEESRADLKG